MAIVQSSPDEEYQGVLGPGPGQRLREARIARGMQVEEVAVRLRLGIHTIECIEADDYAQLPAPAFVRGYLRGYARLLDLPPGPLVDAYAENEFGAPPLVADISTGSEADSTDVPVRVVTYLVVSVLVILVVVWWQSQRAAPRTVSLASDAPAVDTSALTPLVASAAEQSRDGKPATENPPRASAALAPGSTVPETIERSAEAAQLVPVPLGPVAALARGADAGSGALPPPGAAVPIEEPLPPGTLASIETPDGAQAPGAPPDAPAGAVSEPEASPAPAAAQAHATLRIQLGHESWVEVYNRDEKRLYYSLAKAGDTIVISDQPPFRVLLGYTTGVTVEFDGKPFDFSAYRDRGVARFTLGAREGSPAAVADSEADSRPSQQN